MTTEKRTLGDVVEKPLHYNQGAIEVIDALEDWKLGFHLGNVVKYVARAGYKDPAKGLEDLKKASWYLTRYIKWQEDLANTAKPDAKSKKPQPK